MDTDRDALQDLLPSGWEVLAEKRSAGTVGHDTKVWWVKCEDRALVLEGTQRWIIAEIGHIMQQVAR